MRRQNVDEVDMTDAIASSGLKSLGPDKTMNKCSGNLREDRVYSSISENFVDDIHIISNTTVDTTNITHVRHSNNH